MEKEISTSQNKSKVYPQNLEDALKEIARLREENERLRQVLGLSSGAISHEKKQDQNVLFPEAEPLPEIHSKSAVENKIHLFRILFRGREDVFAALWINDKTGKKGYAPVKAAGYGKFPKSNKYLPITDEVIKDHLSGNKVVGVYPLLKDDTCWFLACDFDKTGWELDALEYLATCNRWKIPAYLERSRSGNGGHVWIFFSSPVPAVSARRMGVSLIRETMVARAEMDLASYDRFFPNQDFMPKGGFGNLIALPLQKKARVLMNTEFLDEKLNPWPDQWTFLSQVKRLSPQQVESLLEILPPVTVGPQSIGSLIKPSKQEPSPPKKINCTLKAQIAIEKSGLPPSLISRIKHLASLHNPEFYKKQKLRLSTYQTPRFIKCYREDLSHFYLPRGLFSELKTIVGEAGSKLTVMDCRSFPKSLEMVFQGNLTETQGKAVQTLLSHENGVLVAPPGTGKTIMACAIIASRKVPTLILVHRKPLLEQWRIQIMNNLGLSKKEIGQIGAGRNRQSKIVDFAMIQSLKNKSDIEEVLGDYGFIVVDECHHIPAISFEEVVNHAPVRFILGLTATPYRRDGLQDIITMQCGPIRYRITSKETRKTDDLELNLIIRETQFEYPETDDLKIQEIFRKLVNDAERNSIICSDILASIAECRRVLVLSEWREHCKLLAEYLHQKGKTPFIMDSSLKKKKRDEIFDAIQHMPPEKDLLVIATGNYIGEGFDCPQIDTLFLTFPIAFRGRVVQYVGRLMRQFKGKTNIQVYDYADIGVHVLKKMHLKRLKAYRDIGFESDETGAGTLFTMGGSDAKE